MLQSSPAAIKPLSNLDETATRSDTVYRLIRDRPPLVRHRRFEANLDRRSKCIWLPVRSTPGHSTESSRTSNVSWSAGPIRGSKGCRVQTGKTQDPARLQFSKPVGFSSLLRNCNIQPTLVVHDRFRSGLPVKTKVISVPGHQSH